MRTVFLVSFLCAAVLCSQEPYPGLGSLGLSGFTAEQVTVQKGDTLGSLLRAHRIDPDGNALAAVFVLNPELESVASLRPGTRLSLPVAPPGPPVHLSLATEIKEDLIAAAESLNDLAEKLSTLPTTRLGTPDQREDVIGALDEIRGYLDELNRLAQENRVPLDPELLRQSLVEARLTEATLGTPIRAGKGLTEADRRTIRGISDDLNLKAVNFDEIRKSRGMARWRDVRVVVHLSRASDRAPVSNLRVYYANQHFKDQPEARPFPGMSGQVEGRLLEGDYVLWAAEVGKTLPVTEKVAVKIRKQGQEPVEIDLPVISGKKPSKP